MNETIHPTGGDHSKLTGTDQIPNSAAVLVLGILSIIFCWCFGLIGLIMGIIGLILGGKAKRIYKENPGSYSIGSYKNLNAGYICSLIGTILSGLWLATILLSIILGLALGTSLLPFLPWENMFNNF